MRFLLSLFLILFFQSMAWAENCVPVTPKAHDKNIILSYEGDKNNAQVYFFHNISQQGLWLDHPTNKSMSAGWSSYVRANNWSAFLLNRKNFEISCATIEPGKVNYLDCTKVISVCVAQKATFKTPPKSTYWLAEDKLWDDLIKALAKRGVKVV